MLTYKHFDNLGVNREDLHCSIYVLILVGLSPKRVSLSSHGHYWPLKLHLHSDSPYTPLKVMRDIEQEQLSLESCL